MPLVTYITVVRNGIKEIEQTVQSVLPFRSDKVEYKIVDGRSSDGTVAVIKKYQDQLDGWISEADAGIYDAMNKGVEMATGTFVCFINMGDKLLRCPIPELEEAERKNAAAASFSVMLSDGSVCRPAYSFRLKLENTLPHQGTYYRKSRLPKFDLSLPTFADFDVNQNLFKRKERVSLFPGIVSAFHGVEGVSHNEKNFPEILKVVRRNYGPLYSLLSLFYFKAKYGLKKKLRSASL